MACFIVPVTEAVVVTIVDRVIQKKDKNLETVEAKEEKQEGKIMPEVKSYIRKKLRWLSTMLWGGFFSYHLNMFGGREITSNIAVAFGQSKAKRILIPINLCENTVAGFPISPPENCFEI